MHPPMQELEHQLHIKIKVSFMGYAAWCEVVSASHPGPSFIVLQCYGAPSENKSLVKGLFATFQRVWLHETTSH